MKKLTKKIGIENDTNISFEKFCDIIRNEKGNHNFVKHISFIIKKYLINIMTFFSKIFYLIEL